MLALSVTPPSRLHAGRGGAMWLSGHKLGVCGIVRKMAWTVRNGMQQWLSSMELKLPFVDRSAMLCTNTSQAEPEKC